MIHERKTLKKSYRVLLGAGFLIVLILLWQLIAVLIGKSYLLPSPVQVVQSIASNWQELWSRHIPATLSVMGAGLGISLILGVLLAVLMDLHEGLEKALYPLLAFTQTIPVLCLAPVLVLWFGYSFGMRVVVVVLVTFFPITINMFDGFRSVRVERSELLDTYGAGVIQQYGLLRFPTALPHLFHGLHVAVPWAGAGAVISEWLGAPAGIGVFSKSAMMSMDAAGLLAPLVLLSIIVLIVNMLLNLLEHRFANYHTGD